jgi:hypothetical protein
MKTLITAFVATALVACASGDKRPTMAALNSAAVFHAENEAKPLPIEAAISIPYGVVGLHRTQFMNRESQVMQSATPESHFCT